MSEKIQYLINENGLQGKWEQYNGEKGDSLKLTLMKILRNEGMDSSHTKPFRIDLRHPTYTGSKSFISYFIEPKFEFNLYEMIKI